MISKKLATALGTGTLGAGGAAGAAAWKLGLLVGKSHFANASVSDIKVLSSSNWKAGKATSNHGEISIKIDEGEEDLWQCTIRGFIFGSDKSQIQKIEDQVKQFVEKIKKDGAKRNKFVENCAKARLNAETTDGKVSTIELEIEGSGENLKLKDLNNLLDGDFVGLRRVEGEYKIDHEDAEDWEFSVEKEEKNKKIIVKLGKNGGEFCSIYGDLEGTGFDEGKFDILGEIFKGRSLGEGQSEEDKVSNFEKRKFLFRNCLKNNKKIEGLKVVSDSGKWKFENLEEKLLTKMYKNP